MNLTHYLSDIHWLAVLVLTLFSFFIGFAWHHRYFFGKAWKEENLYGIRPARIKVPVIFAGTAVAHFIALAGLGAVVAGKGALPGFLTGLLISVIWIFPSLAGTYLFADRSPKLLAIDAGMYLVLFSLSGLILGVW